MNARRVFACLCVSVVSIAAATPTLALANRVFVSARSGNNANSCDNILTPCQTFAGAVLQLNPGGEAIVLDSGGYGPVTITQSVIIEAPPGVLAFIHPPSGDAMTINAGAFDVVVLRGLTLNVGTQNGITVNTVGSLYIENCVISGFANNGVLFFTSGSLFAKDTIIRNSGNSGIYMTAASGTAKASIERVRLENGSNGLVAVGTAKVSVRDSVMSGNGSDGIVANDNGGSLNAEVNVENCLVANNGVGITSAASGAGGSTIRVSNTTITDNTSQGVGNGPSGTLLSRGNNTLEGNTSNGTFTGTFLPK